jgi:hypothetical protein
MNNNQLIFIATHGCHEQLVESIEKNDPQGAKHTIDKIMSSFE